MPKEHLYFFGGVDPAISETHRSDDGGIMVGCAQPRVAPVPGVTLSNNAADWYFDFVYARRLTWEQKASARQWSGVIHRLHQNFRFEKVVLDNGAAGGGPLIKRELINLRQIINGVEMDCTPIGTQDEGPKQVAFGHFLLHMFKRGDPGVDALWPELAGDDLLNDALYSSVKDAVDHGLIGWPAPIEEWQAERRDELALWPAERLTALKDLTLSVQQFKNIVVATREDGDFLFTKRNARQFTALGKKDLCSAGMYCYAGFLMWLRTEEWFAGNVSDAGQFSAW